MAKPVIFVHGWSVYNTSTYGEFPARLLAEAQAEGLDIDIFHIWLGKYISFRDEVRVEDIALAMEAALHSPDYGDLADRLFKQGEQFICITHSTGGPVVRDWIDRCYFQQKKLDKCPLSHLIMLAPANFGSALAQLGKSRVGSIKAKMENLRAEGLVEPGVGVLDWLELGSREAMDLNRRYITEYPELAASNNPIYMFALTGQCVDNKLYDHVNSYTGELGGDGVVRAAAANMNATCMSLRQKPIEHPAQHVQDKENISALGTHYKSGFDVDISTSQLSCYRLIENKSHSGTDMGILASVDNTRRKHATVSAVLRCIKVKSKSGYDKLRREFDKETEKIQKAEKKEINERLLLPDHVRIRDSFFMVIFNVRDTSGIPIDNLEIILTGMNNNPNGLPSGFFQDRQANSRSRNTITYFMNHNAMTGFDRLKHKDKVLRERQQGIDELGLTIIPKPLNGFVHYAAGELSANTRVLNTMVKPNQTILIDITMQRLVRQGTFTLSEKRIPEDFSGTDTGSLLEF